MKKFNTPPKGAIYNTADFEHLYKSVKELADALSGVLTESAAPVRITGVEWTVNVSNYSCTEGWLLYQNTIYKVEAFSGTATGAQVPVFKLQTVNAVHEPHDLYEGFNKVGSFFLCTEEKLKPEFGAAGTGLFDYDAIIKNPVKRNSDAIAGLQGLLPGMIVDYYGSLSNFNGSGLGIGDMIGYALCNGQTHDLPSGQFITPDLRGRVIIGKGDSSLAGGNPEANLNEYFEIGNVGGLREVILTINQMPEHNHNVGNGTASVAQGDFGLIRRSATTDTNSWTVDAVDAEGKGVEPDVITTPKSIPMQGGGQAHENRQPYMVLGKVIKLPL
ncbi:hypothetical protein V6R21_19100 [Limibacter armeniacum]|uniref:phage tail protein n=1 Tax=Limibacter armeniacum TaxID=466084 RepID=UPI002FE51D2C